MTQPFSLVLVQPPFYNIWFTVKTIYNCVNLTGCQLANTPQSCRRGLYISILFDWVRLSYFIWLTSSCFSANTYKIYPENSALAKLAYVLTVSDITSKTRNVGTSISIWYFQFIFWNNTFLFFLENRESFPSKLFAFWLSNKSRSNIPSIIIPKSSNKVLLSKRKPCSEKVSKRKKFVLYYKLWDKNPNRLQANCALEQISLQFTLQNPTRQSQHSA